MTIKSDLVQYANELISKSLSILDNNIMKAIPPSKDLMIGKDKDIPLHYLHRIADENNVDIIDHPLADKVKTKYGNTPLHYLGNNGNTGIFMHPSNNIVKNNNGQTPLDLFNLYKKKEKKDKDAKHLDELNKKFFKFEMPKY